MATKCPFCGEKKRDTDDLYRHLHQFHCKENYPTKDAEPCNDTCWCGFDLIDPPQGTLPRTLYVHVKKCGGLRRHVIEHLLGVQS